MLSSTTGPFSFVICLSVACDVHIGGSDLVTVSYCGSSQRAVLHDVAVNSMSLARGVDHFS